MGVHRTVQRRGVASDGAVHTVRRSRTEQRRWKASCNTRCRMLHVAGAFDVPGRWQRCRYHTNRRQVPDKAQAPTPDNSGRPSNNTARPTMAAGHTPAQHAERWRWVTRQHSTADHHTRPTTSKANQTIAAGHETALPVRPWWLVTQQHQMPDNSGGSRTRAACPTKATG